MAAMDSFVMAALFPKERFSMSDVVDVNTITIADCAVGDYALIRNITSESNRKEYIRVVQYVESTVAALGSPTAIWLAKWFLATGALEANVIVFMRFDETELNKIIFSRMKEIKDSATTDLDAAAKDILKTAEEQRAKDITEILKVAERNVSEYLFEARRCDGDALKRTRQAYAKVREIDTLKGRQKRSLLEMIELVHKAGVWKFATYVNGYLCFDTVNDIILTHKNPAAKLNLRVNFGRLRAMYNMKQCSIICDKLERNIKKDGYWHPHIYVDGIVCLGNTAEQVRRALANEDLPLVLQNLYLILSNYNSDSPYVALEDFAIISGQIMPDKEAPLGPDDEFALTFDEYGNCNDCGWSEESDDEHSMCSEDLHCSDSGCSCGEQEEAEAEETAEEIIERMPGGAPIAGRSVYYDFGEPLPDRVYYGPSYYGPSAAYPRDSVPPVQVIDRARYLLRLGKYVFSNEFDEHRVVVCGGDITSGTSHPMRCSPEEQGFLFRFTNEELRREVLRPEELRRIEQAPLPTRVRDENSPIRGHIWGADTIQTGNVTVAPWRGR
jgi:hypothetical protein